MTHSEPPDTAPAHGETPLPSSRRSAFLLTLLAAVIFAAAFLAFEAQKNDIKAHAERNLANIATLKAGGIALWLKERRGDAAIFSGNTPFAAMLDKWLRHGTLEDTGRRWLLWRMNTIVTSYGYQALVLFDPEGEPRLSTTESASADFHERQLALNAIRARQVRFGDLHIGLGGRPVMGMAAPMLVGEGSESRVAGVLYFRIDPGEFLYPLVESWPIESQTAETLLVRRDGDDALFLNHTRHGSAAPLTFRVPIASIELPAVQVLRGRTGFTSGRDYRGEKVVGYLQRIPDTDWGLVAKIDEAEIYAPVRRLAFYIAIALVTLLSFVAYAIWTLHARAEQVQREYQTELRNRVLAQRLAYLSRFANDIILLGDEQGRILDVNDRAVEAYGYARAELLQMDARDLRADDARAAMTDDWRDIMARGHALIETTHRRKDGSTFPVEISVRMIEADRKRYMQAIVRDISERRKLEHAQTEYLERIRELGLRLVAVQEDERRKLGAELHDRTAANLAAMNLLLKGLVTALPVPQARSLAPPIEDLQALMADTTSTIREISADLHPPVLDFLGLDTALNNLASQFGQRLGIPVRVRSTGLHRVDSAVETALYRIVQEALTNCAKHAAAAHIDIDLADAGERIVLTIADDGVGFAPQSPQRPGTPSSLGLLTMRERAEFAGGIFRIDSAPGLGTTIRVEIPNAPAPAAQEPAAAADA